MICLRGFFTIFGLFFSGVFGIFIRVRFGGLRVFFGVGGLIFIIFMSVMRIFCVDLLNFIENAFMIVQAL